MIRAFRCFGTLNNGSEHAGLSCVNGNNNVSNVNWNYAGRPSREKALNSFFHTAPSLLTAKIRER